MRFIAFAHMHDKRGFNKVNWTVSTLIQFFTKSQYFHTEVILDGYWYSAYLTGGKVIKRKLRPLMNKYDYTYVQIEEFEYKRLKRYLDGIVGKEYDLNSILMGHILGLGWSDSKRLYCTEVGLVALHQISMLTDTPDNGTITPQVFFDLTKYLGLARPKKMEQILRRNNGTIADK